jgi:hypothetical protein
MPSQTIGPCGLCFTVDPVTVDGPATAAVLAYWQQKRGRRPMPTRADIEPLELRPILRHVFMIDVLPGEAEFRFRLLGTAITERYGRDSTRKTVRDVYADADPAFTAWYTAMLVAVKDSRRPVLAAGPMLMVRKDFVSFRALHLPLSDDGVTVNVIFGATDFTQQLRVDGRFARPDQTTTD